jgi:hypothetical protein
MEMTSLLRFLEPAALGPWLGHVFILYVVTYSLLWLAAVLVARVGSLERNDLIMQTYIGWMVPTGLHAVFWATVMLQALVRYQQLGFSPWYTTLYLLPIALDAVVIFQLVLVMRDRRRRWNHLEMED